MSTSKVDLNHNGGIMVEVCIDTLVERVPHAGVLLHDGHNNQTTGTGELNTVRGGACPAGVIASAGYAHRGACRRLCGMDRLQRPERGP